MSEFDPNRIGNVHLEAARAARRLAEDYGEALDAVKEGDLDLDEGTRHRLSLEISHAERLAQREEELAKSNGGKTIERN